MPVYGIVIIAVLIMRSFALLLKSIIINAIHWLLATLPPHPVQRGTHPTPPTRTAAATGRRTEIIDLLS